MKKYIFILIIIFCILIIYTVYNERNTICFNINNNYINKCKYNYTYLKEDLRINDIINDLNNNTIINTKYFKNILIKSNIIVLDSRTNELLNKKTINYNYIDNYIGDLDKLLKLLRLYSKEKIYIVGLNNVFNKIYTDYYNNRLKQILLKYKIEFIDINNVKEEEIKENLIKQVDF